MTGPVTLNGLAAGNYTITVRDVANTTCSVTLTHTIAEPAPVMATATIGAQASCTDGGSITAAASGGTPNYTYQLEDTAGSVIGGFDFASNGNNTVFTDLAPGDYLVIARDANGCEDAIDAALTITPANPIVFTATPPLVIVGAMMGRYP